MSNLIDKRLILKQTIIQKDLIDRKYDKQRFLKYCGDKKRNGSDIRNWTLIQLNDLVVSFIKKEKNNTPNLLKSGTQSKEEFKTFNLIIEETNEINEHSKITKDNESQLQPTEIEIEVEGESTKLDKIPILNKEVLEQYEVIQCKKQDYTQLNNKQIIVVIKDTKINDTAIFDFSHISYEIITNEFNWNVKRYYTDFKWLRAMLFKQSPQTTVPLLPKKVSRLKRIDTDLMKKQTKSLQKFIEECLLKELFKASDALLSFLSISDRTQFDIKIKELNTDQLIFKPDELKTFTGTILLSDIEPDDNYYSNIAHFLDSKTKILNKLNVDIKNFQKTIHSSDYQLEEVSKDFESLFQLTEQVELREEITKGYRELSLFFDNMRIIMLNQINLIKMHMKDFFKKIRNDEIALAELIKIREEVNSKYIIECNKTNLKTIKLLPLKESINNYNEDKPITRSSKAFMSLNAKSSKEFEVSDSLHDYIRYLNMALMNEIQDNIINHDSKFETNLKIFTASYYSTLADSLNVWTELTTYTNNR